MTNDFAPVDQDELWICHLSCVSWSELTLWKRYFDRAEEILGTNITHLDKNDPVRRRVKPGKLSEVAGYITAMEKHEDSRWVFGKMETIGAAFTIRLYRELRDARGWPNSIDWYFSRGIAENAVSVKVIRDLFNLGNETLSPFYSYADTKLHIMSKKKESGAVNVQSELVGIFWLTYFNAKYVTFIGNDRFTELQGMRVELESGATLDLGEMPSSVPNGLRSQTEVVLGRNLFVEPKDIVTKRPGQFALSFDQLRA